MDRENAFDPYRNLNTAYDGSAARELDRQNEEEPMVRPLRVPRERPHATVRAAGGISLFAVLGFAVVIVMAVMILFGYVRVADLSAEMNDLNKQLAELRTEEESMTARYELKCDISEIETSLTQDGSMSKPQVGQMVYVDLTEEDSVTTFAEENRRDAGIIGFISNIYEKIRSYF